MTTFRGAALLVLLALVAAGCSSGAASGAPASPTLRATAVGPGVDHGHATGDQPDRHRLGPHLGHPPEHDFPTVAGSSPGEETATGPASATSSSTASMRRPSSRPSRRAQGRRLHDRRALGPLENGGYSLDMTGAATGCKVRVSMAPTGGLTRLTILYGAGCPHG